MHRLCSALLLVVSLGASSCDGAAVELRVALERGAGASLEGLDALRFVVRELAADAPEVFGPVSLSGTREYRLSATVTPGAEFYVDVWGCPSVDACRPDEMLARGCSPILSIEEDTAIDIAMFDVDQPEAGECPPGT